LPCETDREVVIAKGRRNALPAWRYVSAELQLLLGLVALDEMAESLAFSLNFGVALLATLTPGCPSTRDVVRNRISRLLKSKLKRDVAFIVVLEETWDGRLHAHGAVQADRDEMPRVDEALRAAGGNWTAVRGEDHQLHLAPIWSSCGWWDYLIKDLRRAGDRKANWIGWSLPAKRVATALHLQLRRWWTMNREDLVIRHSMHFYVGDVDLADDLAAWIASAARPSVSDITHAATAGALTRSG
jgi:hypothetical protein